MRPIIIYNVHFAIIFLNSKNFCLYPFFVITYIINNNKGQTMETLSMILNSSILMYIFAVVFLYIAIRCFIFGVANDTSIVLRVLVGLLFLCFAAYCGYRGYNAPAKNFIDNFFFDSWTEMKRFFGFVKKTL